MQGYSKIFNDLPNFNINATEFVKILYHYCQYTNAFPEIALPLKKTPFSLKIIENH